MSSPKKQIIKNIINNTCTVEELNNYILAGHPIYPVEIKKSINSTSVMSCVIKYDRLDLLRVIISHDSDAYNKKLEGCDIAIERALHIGAINIYGYLTIFYNKLTINPPMLTNNPAIYESVVNYNTNSNNTYYDYYIDVCKHKYFAIYYHIDKLTRLPPELCDIMASYLYRKN